MAVRGWFLAIALALAAPAPVRAWVYPEHRELALAAVQTLDAEHRAQFERWWSLARAGSEQRLCAAGADAAQGLAPNCIDWAALSAIAGDHSCSSREMLETARTAPWILQVADVGAQLRVDLARIPVTAAPESAPDASNPFSDAQRRLASEGARAERLNALRTADIRLQRADPAYATRAGSSNAHFLIPRPSTDTSVFDYAEITLRAGSELNAIGVYAYFHMSALQKASRLARETLDDTQRQALARAMLADEAFALHFLQDVYAAGHIAGTWGSASQRQGTHDYYNRSGLEVPTWQGGSRTLVLMGDAHMRPEDRELASASLHASLQQVLDVAAGRADALPYPHTPAAPAAADGFDVCTNARFPQREEGQRRVAELRPLLEATLLPTPVPGLGPGLGAMPRFRNEVGVFVGLAGSIDGRAIDGSFVDSQTARGGVAGIDLSVRAGFGLDGVMNESGDGLVFASLGLRSDGPSSNQFSTTSGTTLSGHLGAAIPARSALTMRLRMPFYLIPGDMLLMSPLFFINRDAYTAMAVTAGNGGLIPWQAGWATAIGRFQFVLGRELGVTFWGRSGDDQLIAPSAAPGSPARVVRFRSTSYDLPIFEYRPYRAFSMNQSSSVIVQLFAAADVPTATAVDLPLGAPLPKLHTLWSVGLRLVFDWRYYYD